VDRSWAPIVSLKGLCTICCRPSGVVALGDTRCGLARLWGTPCPPCSRGWRVSVMGWTDERVETLKKLWLDGLSASQDRQAAWRRHPQCGDRQVHRLGLSGRAAPSQPARQSSSPRAPARPVAASQPAAAARRRRNLAEIAPVQAPRPVTYVEEPGNRHGADAGGSHVQVADRRSFDGRLHFLRSPLRRRRPLLQRARQGGLPAAADKKKSGATELAAAFGLHLGPNKAVPPLRGEGRLVCVHDRPRA